MNTQPEKTVPFPHSNSEIIHRAAAFAGPLPPPEILAGYERIHPGCADRIIAMAEANSAARIEMQKNTLLAKRQEVFVGQAFGLIIGVAGLISAVVLGIYGESTAASVVGGSTVLGLVAVFVTGRHALKPNNLS